MITDPLPTNPLFALLTSWPPGSGDAKTGAVPTGAVEMRAYGQNREIWIVHETGRHPSP